MMQNYQKRFMINMDYLKMIIYIQYCIHFIVRKMYNIVFSGKVIKQ